MGNIIHQAGRLGIAVFFLDCFGRYIRRQSGGMGQQIHNADIRFLTRLRVGIRFESGNIHTDFIRQPVFPLLQQLHHGGGGAYRFTAGSQIENRIFRHLFRFRIYGLISVCF